MKKTTLFFLLIAISLYSFGQSAAGLVAHWDMNGSPNDVSGNGHNGHATNVTSAAGISGLANTAYYFNGANSKITTGYQPDLQLTQYSICAVVKITGFYAGTCQGNFILTRGKSGTAGAYTLQFNDNPNDGNNCLAFDSTQDVFCANAGSTGPGSSVYLWSYTPPIARDYWYKVVATWNGTQYKIFVNDTLKTTLVSSTGTMGSSADSLAIGYNIFEAAYPYPFKGLIDDIRIYNRVLTDTEIVHYGDTCGQIVLEPSSPTAAVGSTTTFVISSTIPGATYQWQQDAGSGYTNLANSGPYSGVTTNTLTITGVTAALNSFHYRCLVSNSWGCADTTVSALLTTGVAAITSDAAITVYPNPTHDKVTIYLSKNGAGGDIQVINAIGQVVINQKIDSTDPEVNLSTLPAGIYTLKITRDDANYCHLLIKN